MFCMNCGQQLPNGAKFCLQCGTPQGAVSPTGSLITETINLDGTHTFVPAMCPNCNAHMKVDSSSQIARCVNCGTECLVQDAIKALTVRGNVQVGNATINVNGTNTDSLLRRVEIMLGDGDFDGALSKCDTILDSDPTNGEVYFYMLLSDLRCRTRSELANQQIPFDGNQYYSKAIQYGDEKLKAEIKGYINAIDSRNEAKLKNSKVGDIFYFGFYNGQRLFWKVFQIQERMAFVISTENICSMPYHQLGGSITWSNCTLREWLNNDFFNGTFSQKERTRILPCDLINDNNPKYNTPGGDRTTDKVFLLSIKEANALFTGDQARANGSCWWLRSPGNFPDSAAYVNNYGEVDVGGDNVYDFLKDSNGVRPVLCLSLN